MDLNDAFYLNFNRRMSVIGLPAPSTLYGSLQLALANIGAIASGVHKLGTKATLREVFVTFPTFAVGASATTVAGALAEGVLVATSILACFYVGACVGALIGATIDVYGSEKLIQLQSWAGDVSRKLGVSMRELLESTIKAIPSTNPIRGYVCVAANKFAPEACRAPWLP